MELGKNKASAGGARIATGRPVAASAWESARASRATRSFLALALGISLLAAAGVSAGRTVEHTLPLFTAAGDLQQGFARIINHSHRAGPVHIHATDDDGRRYGPVTLHLEAGATRHFNSGDLELGNAAKGLSAGLGDGEGSWRLRLVTDLDIEPSAYIRTPDGFLASVHDVAPATEVDGKIQHRVSIFNPASNLNQVSWLRLVNLSNASVDVEVRGQDDPYDVRPDQASVSLTLPPRAARRVSAQQLEAGASGLDGRFPDGEGKWQLFVEADGDIEVVSLLQTPTGHLTNLSAPNRRPAENRHTLPLFRSAGHSQQGFARIINRSVRPGTVQIFGTDDIGQRRGPVTLGLDTLETRHFNSEHLESGGAGLSEGLGDGFGDWRLELYSDVDIEPSAYVRTTDGFLTSMHDIVRKVDGSHRVPIFNPGSNRNQVSWLRVANLADAIARVTISGVDDAGEAAPPGHGGASVPSVRLELPPRAARRISAQQLESGLASLSGRLWDGAGMWQLQVVSDEDIEVVSLLQSPTGHLSNLSLSGTGDLGELTIATSSPGHVAPLERISLQVPGGLAPKSDYTVVLDVSGAGAFEEGDVIEVPGLTTNEDEVLFAAPVLTASPQLLFSVRLRRELDNRRSNVLSFSLEPMHVPAELSGYPIAILDTLLHLAFTYSEDEVLNNEANDRPLPGQLVDVAKRLELDTSFADVLAEALLRRLFGVSAVEAYEALEAERRAGEEARTAADKARAAAAEARRAEEEARRAEDEARRAAEAADRVVDDVERAEEEAAIAEDAAHRAEEAAHRAELNAAIAEDAAQAADLAAPPGAEEEVRRAVDEAHAAAAEALTAAADAHHSAAQARASADAAHEAVRKARLREEARRAEDEARRAAEAADRAVEDVKRAECDLVTIGVVGSGMGGDIDCNPEEDDPIAIADGAGLSRADRTAPPPSASGGGLSAPVERLKGFFKCARRTIDTWDYAEFTNCQKDLDIDLLRSFNESRNKAIEIGGQVSGSSNFWQTTGTTFKGKVEGDFKDSVVNHTVGGALKLTRPLFQSDNPIAGDCGWDYCSDADGNLHPSRSAAEKSYETLTDLGEKTTFDQEAWDAWIEEEELYIESLSGEQDKIDALQEWESTARQQTRDFEEIEDTGESYFTGEEEDPLTPDPDNENGDPETPDPEDTNGNPGTPDDNEGSTICTVEASILQVLSTLTSLLDPSFECEDLGLEEEFENSVEYMATLYTTHLSYVRLEETRLWQWMQQLTGASSLEVGDCELLVGDSADSLLSENEQNVNLSFKLVCPAEPEDDSEQALECLREVSRERPDVSEFINTCDRNIVVHYCPIEAYNGLLSAPGGYMYSGGREQICGSGVVPDETSAIPDMLGWKDDYYGRFIGLPGNSDLGWYSLTGKWDFAACFYDADDFDSRYFHPKDQRYVFESSTDGSFRCRWGDEESDFNQPMKFRVQTMWTSCQYTDFETYEEWLESRRCREDEYRDEAQ